MQKTVKKLFHHPLLLQPEQCPGLWHGAKSYGHTCPAKKRTNRRNHDIVTSANRYGGYPYKLGTRIITTKIIRVNSNLKVNKFKNFLKENYTPLPYSALICKIKHKTLKYI